MTDDNNLPARPEDVADVMLNETASSNALLLFEKGKYSSAGNDVEIGTQFISYPFDAMRGLVRWQDKRVVDRRMGRIRDRFKLKREELPADEDPPALERLDDRRDVPTYVDHEEVRVGGEVAPAVLVELRSQPRPRFAVDLPLPRDVLRIRKAHEGRRQHRGIGVGEREVALHRLDIRPAVLDRAVRLAAGDDRAWR